MRSPLACALAVAAGACSSSPSAHDASANPCLVPGDYGALGTQTGTAIINNGNPTLTITLDPGPPRDVFFIQLISGQGAFTGGGLMTGTFAIRGADTSFTACGLCVNVIADIVSGVGPTKFYLASSGMVTLTRTSPIAGSAQDLHFVETDVGSGQPVAGGCTTTVASLAFGS